jgi:hypothetical protein
MDSVRPIVRRHSGPPRDNLSSPWPDTVDAPNWKLFMVSQSVPQDPTFGYLSTLESPDHGFFGGYLIVSLLGRPLEFHCTAPLQPSRAQEILYGATLQPYLLGEQIGGTLLAQAKLRPDLILTDQVDVFCLRSQSSVPVVWLVHAINGTLAAEVPQTLTSETTSMSPRPESLATRQFSLGDCRWELPAGYEADRPIAVDLLHKLARHVDLAEPFDRIHEAIREAQRIGGRNQDAHGQAA